MQLGVQRSVTADPQNKNVYSQQQGSGMNPLSMGMNLANLYKGYNTGTGIFGFLGSGTGAGAGAGTGATGIASTGASSGLGASGAGLGSGLAAGAMWALPAYIAGGLAAGSADPETFGKLPLVGTTGEALNGLFNGNGLKEFFDSDNIAQNLLPGIGDFMSDEQADSIFKPVEDLFGNIFGF